MARTVPASPVVPTTAIAVAAVIMLGVATVFAAALSGITSDEYRMVGDYLQGRATGPLISEVVDLDGDRQRTLTMFALAYIAAGVVFMCWQFRHARNAIALAGPGGLGPGWAIGGWFIPGAAAVLPAIEVYQSSRRSSPPGRGRRLRAVGDGLLVVAWMASLSVGLWATVRAGLDDVSVFHVPDLHDRLAFARVGGVLLVVSGMLAVVMVASFTRRQRRLLDQRFVRPYGYSGW